MADKATKKQLNTNANAQNLWHLISCLLFGKIFPTPTLWKTMPKRIGLNLALFSKFYKKMQEKNLENGIQIWDFFCLDRQANVGYISLGSKGIR
jgi:hypothetical protein